MKTIFSKITLLFFVFVQTAAHSQEKTEQQKQMETLLNSKEFIFTAQTVIPQGMQKVMLSTSSYYLKVHPESIESHLPYYGRAYSGTPYGGESGIQFSGAMSEYKMTQSKKNYEIEAIVKANNDTYKINLSVGFEGGAYLRVFSNKRSTIAYEGTISPAISNSSKDKQ